MNVIDKKVIEIIESKDRYISDLVDHISDLEKDKADLLEDLQAEHNANRITDGSFEFPEEHELDCYTCKLIKRMEGKNETEN